MLQKEVLKGTRWLLLKNPENLDAEKDEKRRLEEALALNKPLATAYYLKEDLRRFWEQPGKRFATTFLDGWIRRAEASGIKMLQQMAKTLAAHRSGLLAYYDVMITSGPMEGTNNKIKTMNGRPLAFGFRLLMKYRTSTVSFALALHHRDDTADAGEVAPGVALAQAPRGPALRCRSDAPAGRDSSPRWRGGGCGARSPRPRAPGRSGRRGPHADGADCP